MSLTYLLQHTYIEEFIPKIGLYLHCLINFEGILATSTCQSCKSAQFKWRCLDCFLALVLCKECCRKSHRWLPFHRVQKWSENHFMPSWLQEVGVCLQFGHSGDPCPNQIVCYKAFYNLKPILKQLQMDFDYEEECEGGSNNILADDCPAAVNQNEFQFGFGSSISGQNDKDGNPIITIVDRSGIHEIGVRCCCYPNAPELNMQLMLAGLFPATFQKPKMAFTFRVLEEFHPDNLECKTTLGQFISCLRRLTNDEFPNTVLVGQASIFTGIRLTSRYRINIGSY